MHASAMKTSEKTRKELRRFGLVMAAPLAVIGGYLAWQEQPAAPYVLGVAAAFLLCGLLVPAVLRPVEKAWMAMAGVLSAVMTRVLLTLAFFLVITPFGLLLRVMGKDLLQIRPGSRRESYWMPVEPDGPATRPDKPY